jgi:calcium-dependent protein kinase
MEVDHPNIIKFYEVYSDAKYYRIVMEYCEGGELFQHLTQWGRLSEPVSAQIIKQLIAALKHLHEMNIAHRDLKPENVIFATRGDSKKIHVKLIDFGLSKKFKEDFNQMRTKLGTPYYVSPEVLEGTYDKRCDLWSLGVMTYMLICGYPPFNGKTDAEVFYKIRCANYGFPDEDPSTPPKDRFAVSDEAKDFISRLLKTDPNRRMTVDEAQNHPWITKLTSQSSSEVKLCPDVIERLTSQ